MNIEAAGSHPGNGAQAAGQARTSGQEARLRDACQEFEGMLVATILKQGFATGMNEAETSSGNGLLREFALEQTARELGKNGAFGIADLLYRQLQGQEGQGNVS